MIGMLGLGAMAGGGGAMSPAVIGSLAGSAVGAGGGILESREQKKREREAKKERRSRKRMAAVQGITGSIKESQAMRQRALVALGQAHMDYASMF